MPTSNDEGTSIVQNIDYLFVQRGELLPAWLKLDDLVGFLSTQMVPYQDTAPDVRRGLEYAFSDSEEKGGFAVLALHAEELLGAVVFLKTGMKGYVPDNLLLFVCVDPKTRGQGIGKRLIEKALSHCDGAVKLHVEPDNPARRLYERMGFENKYLEMRYQR